jgi:hypothetical protein
MPNTEILRKYGSDTTTVALGDADVNSITLSVVQTDWKPSPKKPKAAVNVTPGDLVKGLFNSDDDDDDGK